MTRNMLKQYKLLKKRIDYAEKEIELYKFSLKYKNQKLRAKTLTEWFGYQSSVRIGGYPSLRQSRLGKYIELLPQQYRSEIRYAIIRDVVWVPLSIVSDFEIRSWMTKANYEHLLVEREKVPFWLLSEYGGIVKDQNFIGYLQSKIDCWKDEIKILKERDK